MSKEAAGPPADGIQPALGPSPEEAERESEPPARIGEYTWRDFMAEFGYEEEIDTLYQGVAASQADTGGIFSFGESESQRVPEGEDWDRVRFDPTIYLGFHPDETEDQLREGASEGADLYAKFQHWIETTPVVKGKYTWEHYKWDYYYDDSGRPPLTKEGTVAEFDRTAELGFDPETIEDRLTAGAAAAEELLDIEEERTVYVNPDLDEDEFFSTTEGHTTIVNRYDLEKAVPLAKKRHFLEVERYWVNKPYAFIILFHSVKENEKKYYVIDPHLNEIEDDLVEYLSGKLRTSIKYSDDEVVVEGSDEERGKVLEDEIMWLLDRNDLRDPATKNGSGLLGELKSLVGLTNGADLDREPTGELEGSAARPEPAILEEDSGWLTEYQVEKLLYIVRRDFIGYERIDPIKHDINVEDISCDGYESPVFVYHTDYENLITNLQHGRDQLDNFVIKLAQRSGKGISKRQPQVDATLPDGSRAQLTLGTEVSDHGTNYTIRQFKDVPFTPVDLVNWKTFSMDEMAFLWLCIESNKSLIFAGGTASGKTTSLNAVSLFIPSNTKIVSIEDTREVELPQRNWVASVTRPSFTKDNTGDIDEFDLLEAALRQRPDYIVMGEVRGEEGRTLFQVMSTGHTTYTTFHADNVDEVLKRFTTDPINVSKTLFTALDLVSVQTQTKVKGKKVRRNTMITEINSYDAENDEVSVQDVFQWQPDGDEFLQHGESQKLDEIAFDRGWSMEQLTEEMFERRTVLAYLIVNELNTYTQVAATVQAYINDPDTILTLMANDELEASLEDLREMESVLIDVDPHKEKLVPRPDPEPDVLEEAKAILAEAKERVFAEYEGKQAGSLLDALATDGLAEDITVPTGLDRKMLAAIWGEASDGAEAGEGDGDGEDAHVDVGAGDTGAPELGPGTPPQLEGTVPDLDQAGFASAAEEVAEAMGEERIEEAEAEAEDEEAEAADSNRADVGDDGDDGDGDAAAAQQQSPESVDEGEAESEGDVDVNADADVDSENDTPVDVDADGDADADAGTGADTTDRDGEQGDVTEPTDEDTEATDEDRSSPEE